MVCSVRGAVDAGSAISSAPELEAPTSRPAKPGAIGLVASTRMRRCHFGTMGATCSAAP